MSDFRDIVGDDPFEPGEEERLLRVHELLRAAGPPEELPPTLSEPPEERGAKVIGFPVRRRVGTLLVAAASLAAIFFGGGYWLGADRGGSFHAATTYTMRGADNRFASIRMAPADAAFNWPLQLKVRGLRDLPKGGYYELLLTRDGKAGPSCGTFRTHDGKTTIVLNAPYPLKQWNGWIIVAHYPNEKTSGPLLSTRLS